VKGEEEVSVGVVRKFEVKPSTREFAVLK
jgi:hypothetical protein